jgi:small GTP-binding protein
VNGATFAEQRDSLIPILSELAAHLERNDVRDAATSARAVTKKLEEESFNVVVLGAFKRGKSTLVNALLGEELLPTAAIPLTSVVTCVAWGERPHAEVTFTDGIEEVPTDEIARYVTEAQNPANALGVERVVVTHPSPDLADGIFLVDTPGTESVHRHNTDLARGVLRDVDAAIFVTSADPPISDTERTFLEEVRDAAVRVFVVLNKIDHVSDKERDQTLAFTLEVVRRSLEHDVVVYPMSARQALEAKVSGDEAELERSGLPAFERDFRGFLLRAKGDVLLAATRRRARAIVLARVDELRVESSLFELTSDQLAAAVGGLERVFVDAQRTWDDMAALLERDTKGLVEIVEHDLAALWTSETESLHGRMERALDEMDRIEPVAIEELLRNALRADLDDWRREEDRKISDAFRRTALRFIREADEVLVRTIDLAGEALGIELSSRPEPVELSGDGGFTYHFFEMPTILESLLPDARRHLPRKMARRLVERGLEARIPMIVDKHCGRLRYDFVRRLEGSRLALRRELDQRLAATIAGIQRGAERSRTELLLGTERIAERRSQVEGEQRELEAIIERIGLEPDEHA